MPQAAFLLKYNQILVGMRIAFRGQKGFWAMRSIFYIMSLVSLGFPYPVWADALSSQVELSEANAVDQVELENDHHVEVTLDRPDCLNGQRLVIGLESSDQGVNPKLLNSFSLNLITVDQRMESDQKTKLTVKMGTSTSVIGKILTSSIQGVQLLSTGIEFELPMLADLKHLLQLKIRLVRDNRIYQDVSIMDEELDVLPFAEVSGGSLKVKIPSNRIGDGSLAGKKFNLELKVRMKSISEKILNLEDLKPIFERQLETEMLGVIAR